MQIGDCQGLGGGVAEEKPLNGQGFLLWSDGNILELDGGGGLTTIRM